MGEVTLYIYFERDMLTPAILHGTVSPETFLQNQFPLGPLGSSSSQDRRTPEIVL